MAEESNVEYLEVSNLGEITEGKPVPFTIGNLSICIVKLDGRYYAFSNVCTHIGGRLSDGQILTKDRITCPEHKAVFRIQDGESLSFPRRGLMVFPTLLKNGKLYVEKIGKERWREPLPSSEKPREDQ
jgi:nitrite reductase/ring-hydroxylating ferredoxin subunit